MLRGRGQGTVVHIGELALGALLAEGGEGRVFEVQREPAPVVYKQFRHPRPAGLLAQTVLLPDRLAPGFASRVRAASAWPVALVVGDDPGVALGALMPRAPATFWLRHREGQPRLATLSYLASDPDRITVAYGTVVPAPGAPERVGVVYALARLLEAWQHGAGGAGAPASARSRGPGGPAGDEHGAGGAGTPASARSRGPGGPAGDEHGAGGAGALVVHGDLSAKNVLWSLDPAPAVYVLDCDGVRVVGPGELEPGLSPGELGLGELSPGELGPGLSPGELGPGEESVTGQASTKPRATTPNWEDPAQAGGAPPSAGADRYALGLVFLRVVGAAHFPVQARQRSGEKLSVDLELPRSWRRLPDMPRLWELCERSLSIAGAGDRPSPGEWAAELEELLAAMGSAGLAAKVRALQGDPRPSSGPALGADRQRREGRVTVPDVEVQPLVRHRVRSTWALVNAAGPPAQPRSAEGLAGVGLATGLGLRQLLRRAAQAWASAHRLAFGLLRSRGRRRDGLHRLAGVLALDLAAACVALFLVGMIVSPWIGL